MALPPDKQNRNPEPDEKPHWSQRAKQGVAKTLDFIKTYTPAILSTAVRVTAVTTIVSSVAAGTGASFVSPEVAGVLGALASQSKRIWELVKDMKDYLDSAKDTLDETPELDEKDQMIQELRERIDGLQSNHDTLVEAINQLSSANEQLTQGNEELMQGNEQLREALGKYYRKEIKDYEVAGLLERYPFDFDKEGTLFGEVENGVKVPGHRNETAPKIKQDQLLEEVALIEDRNDFDNDCPR